MNVNIPQLVTQKKAQVATATSAAMAATVEQVGIEWTAGTLFVVFLPLMLYILAQGASDWGKEAAKVQKGGAA